MLVAAQLVIGCIGLYGFGITGADIARYGPFLPDFFFGMEVMGMVLGAVASALYIVDAHRKSTLYLTHHRGGANTNEEELAVEAFTCMLVFKNMFSFGLTSCAYNWLLQDGIVKIFLIIGSVQVVICLLSIPMCKFYHRL